MLKVNLFAIERTRYSGYTSCCAICFKTHSETKLLKCSSCQLVFYCSKAHQVRHWDTHKQVCKAVKQFFSAMPLHMFDVSHSSNYIEAVSTGFKHYLFLNVKRYITSQERCLVSCPVVCNVCLTSLPTLAIFCEKCGIVAYCGDSHKSSDQTNHARVCDLYKRCVEYDNSCHKQLFFTGYVKDVKSLPVNMAAFSKEAFHVETIPKGREQHAVWYLSNIMSSSLTIIYVMKKMSGFIEKIKENNDGVLTIYIHHPTWLVINAWWTWEYIFHYFDWLKRVNLWFLTPIDENTGLITTVTPAQLFCDKCRLTRKLDCQVVTASYEDFIKIAPSKPDMVFTFDSMFENEAWITEYSDFYTKILKMKDVILTITSFTNIKTSSKEKLKKLKATFLLEKVNPFRSLVIQPHLRFVFNGDTYSNNYITVVKT